MEEQSLLLPINWTITPGGGGGRGGKPGIIGGNMPGGGGIRGIRGGALMVLLFEISFSKLEWKKKTVSILLSNNWFKYLPRHLSIKNCFNDIFSEGSIRENLAIVRLRKWLAKRLMYLSKQSSSENECISLSLALLQYTQVMQWLVHWRRTKESSVQRQYEER